MKNCIWCKQDKELTEFHKRSSRKDGLDYYCKSCVSEKSKAYREKNKDALKERKKIDYEKNKEHYSRYKREWKRKNRERLNEKNRKYFKENPVQRFISSFRGRMWKFLNGYSGYKGKTQKALGCSPEELKAHIESKFKKGMSWENYGEWHIDHIIPLNCASDFDDIFTLSHYSNLQPMWWNHNLMKGTKMPDDLIELGLVNLETGEFTAADGTSAEVVE
jgi:hypothetical protein